MDALLYDTANRILMDHADAPEALWAALEESGLLLLWANEADGGFGLEPADGFSLVRLAGAHAAPVPFADTLMATWFLSEAGLSLPAGPMSVLVEGFQRGIAFGDHARHIVHVKGRSVSLLEGAIDKPSYGIGLDPVTEALAVPAKRVEAGDMPGDTGALFAALVRASQICGALDAVLDLTIGFAEQREQFGRPLSKFQAIQHLLSEMGSEAAAASAAVDIAVSTVRRGGVLDPLTVAAAKHRACVAAGIVSEHAHQVHGAIGYTQEYSLASLTRRLWQWREDFGGEAYWANVLGKALLADRAPLWPKLASISGVEHAQ